MSRYYIAATPLQPGRGAIRYAIAFHDSGRQGNGPDYWESDSAGNCTEFLLRQGYSAVSGMTPAAVGLLITKGGSGHWGLEKRIVHDADVLDIMRPCCGHGGRAGFRESYLRFLGPRDDVNSQNLSVRAQLIEEAWRFIQASELCKYDLVGAADYMTDMLGILAKGQSDWPLLSEHLL
jgi:hypothetical protein